MHPVTFVGRPAAVTAESVLVALLVEATAFSAPRVAVLTMVAVTVVEVVAESSVGTEPGVSGWRRQRWWRWQQQQWWWYPWEALTGSFGYSHDDIDSAGAASIQAAVSAAAAASAKRRKTQRQR